LDKIIFISKFLWWRYGTLMGDRHGACFVFSEVTLVHGEFWSWSLHWVACGWL